MQSNEAQTPGSNGSQGTPSDLQNLNLESPALVEGDGSAPPDRSDKGREFNVHNFVQANKRVTDGLKKDLAEIKELLAQRSQLPAQTQVAGAPEPSVDIWTNPQAYIQSEVKKALDQGVRQEIGLNNLAREQKEAEAYILSQSYVDPEADSEELKRIYDKGGFKYAWNADPYAAAETILEIFKSRRGISDKRNPGRVQAGSAFASSGSAANNGKKFWTTKEIRAMSLEDYRKRENEIEEARLEGRVEGAKVSP